MSHHQMGSCLTGVLFFCFNHVRKSRGERKHTRTGYVSYHLTMKEHGGRKFDTNHHDFTSVVAFMFVRTCWCVARWLSAPIGEDLRAELTPLSCCWGPTMRLQRKYRCTGVWKRPHRTCPSRAPSHFYDELALTDVLVMCCGFVTYEVLESDTFLIVMRFSMEAM